MNSSYFPAVSRCLQPVKLLVFLVNVSMIAALHIYI